MVPVVKIDENAVIKGQSRDEQWWTPAMVMVFRVCEGLTLWVSEHDHFDNRDDRDRLIDEKQPGDFFREGNPIPGLGQEGKPENFLQLQKMTHKPAMKPKNPRRFQVRG